MRPASRNPRVSGVEGALIDRKSLAASSDSGVSCQTAPSSSAGARRAAVVVVDLHVEAAGAARHRAPDPAHSEDPEALSGHVHAEHHRGVPAHPLAGPHHPVALGTAPGRPEQAEHRHVGGGVVQDIGRVGHDDAPRLRRVHRDVLVADRVGGEDPDGVWEAFDHAGGQRVAAGAEEPVLTLAGLQEAVRGVDAVFGVQCRIVVAREPRLDVGRHAAGAEDSVLVGHGAAFLLDSLFPCRAAASTRRRYGDPRIRVTSPNSSPSGIRSRGPVNVTGLSPRPFSRRRWGPRTPSPPACRSSRPAEGRVTLRPRCRCRRRRLPGTRSCHRAAIPTRPA